jgi:hypothetical protein
MSHQRIGRLEPVLSLSVEPNKGSGIFWGSGDLETGLWDIDDPIALDSLDAASGPTAWVVPGNKITYAKSVWCCSVVYCVHSADPFIRK